MTGIVIFTRRTGPTNDFSKPLQMIFEPGFHGSISYRARRYPLEIKKSEITRRPSTNPRCRLGAAKHSCGSGIWSVSSSALPMLGTVPYRSRPLFYRKLTREIMGSPSANLPGWANFTLSVECLSPYGVMKTMRELGAASSTH